MKPWEVWTWKFPDAGEHPAVVLGIEERLRLKPRVCVIPCSTQRATRKAEVHEVILTGDDLGVVDTSGVVNPGTFQLSKVGVAEDGVIYAANFGTIGSATPAFTVYRWDDEAAIATIAYSADPGAGNIQQWGTTFDVRGAGPDTQILVSSSAGTIAALLTTVDVTRSCLRWIPITA